MNADRDRSEQPAPHAASEGATDPMNELQPDFIDVTTGRAATAFTPPEARRRNPNRWPTPQEFIAEWEQHSPERRLQLAERIIADGQTAMALDAGTSRPVAARATPAQVEAAAAAMGCESKGDVCESLVHHPGRLSSRGCGWAVSVADAVVAAGDAPAVADDEIEAATADLRAEVKRLKDRMLALADDWESKADDNEECGYAVTARAVRFDAAELRAALAGPTPEATESSSKRNPCPRCGHDHRRERWPHCVCSCQWAEPTSEATEGGDDRG